MPLPAKDAPPTEENVRQLRYELTRRISGHPEAGDPCSFYQFVDDYLGPWGERGYPIGYGLYYCRLFGSNARLAADPVASQWVRNTRVHLQELLRDHRT